MNQMSRSRVTAVTTTRYVSMTHETEGNPSPSLAAVGVLTAVPGVGVNCAPHCQQTVSSGNIVCPHRSHFAAINALPQNGYTSPIVVTVSHSYTHDHVEK